jgi:hypothetical protein
MDASQQHAHIMTYNPRADADVTYTIVISERQLHYIRLALREFVANDPGEELDTMGQDIPTVLEEMLADALAPSPAVNGLVL